MITLKQARKQIEQILEMLPDSALPKPDRIEKNGDETTVWFGGHGYHLGMCRNGWGEHVPGGPHRTSGSWDALTQEAVHRLDVKHPRVETTTERRAREAAEASA